MTIRRAEVDPATLKLDQSNIRTQLDDEIESLRLGESLAKKQLRDIIVHEDSRVQGSTPGCDPAMTPATR